MNLLTIVFSLVLLISLAGIVKVSMEKCADEQCKSLKMYSIAILVPLSFLSAFIVYASIKHM